MKFFAAISLFLAAVAHAEDDFNSVARGLTTDPEGIFHVGRDGVLRSFSRDLEVIDAAPLKRHVILESRDIDESVDAFAVSARDMFKPSEDIVAEIKALRERGTEEMARRAGNLQARCGGWCNSHGSCAPNEQSCQWCSSNSCGL